MCACHVLEDKWHFTSGSAAFNLFHCSFLFLEMVTRTILFNCFSNSSDLRHLFLSAFLLFQTCIFLSAQPSWLVLQYSSFQHSDPHSAWQYLAYSRPHCTLDWKNTFMLFVPLLFLPFLQNILFLHSCRQERLWKSELKGALKKTLFSQTSIAHFRDVDLIFINYASLV